MFRPPSCAITMAFFRPHPCAPSPEPASDVRVPRAAQLAVSCDASEHAPILLASELRLTGPCRSRSLGRASLALMNRPRARVCAHVRIVAAHTRARERRNASWDVLDWTAASDLRSDPYGLGCTDR